MKDNLEKKYNNAKRWGALGLGLIVAGSAALLVGKIAATSHDVELSKKNVNNFKQSIRNN